MHRLGAVAEQNRESSNDGDYAGERHCDFCQRHALRGGVGDGLAGEVVRGPAMTKIRAKNKRPSKTTGPARVRTLAVAKVLSFKGGSCDLAIFFLLQQNAVDQAAKQCPSVRLTLLLEHSIGSVARARFRSQGPVPDGVLLGSARRRRLWRSRLAVRVLVFGVDESHVGQADEGRECGADKAPDDQNVR